MFERCSSTPLTKRIHIRHNTNANVCITQILGNNVSQRQSLRALALTVIIDAIEITRWWGWAAWRSQAITPLMEIGSTISAAWRGGYFFRLLVHPCALPDG